MGKEVEAIALAKGYTIPFIIDENNRADLNPRVLSQADVVVEFTGPDAAFQNIMACLDAGVPIVSGTTGWLDRFEQIKEECSRRNGGFFYASNFSIGVNLFFDLNARLAELMSSHPEYSVRIEEVHHKKKKDAPSGTALTLAKQVITENRNINGWTEELIAPEGQIGMTSIREGNVTGTHSVIYLSQDDKITIRHEAFSRRGLASGAIMAAEFMVGRSGVYTMKDLISHI